MTTQPKSRCSTPGCPNKFIGRGKCPSHRAQYERERGTKEVWRDYNTEWKTIRKAYILANPMCISCGNVAQEVDHITPLRLGGTHNQSNLQSMCKPCHSRKTAYETLHRGRGV